MATSKQGRPSGSRSGSRSRKGSPSTPSASARKAAAQRVLLVERVKALRKVARGFDAADGFDLRRPENLTPSEKARVTRYAKVLDRMTVGQRKLVRASGKRLRKLQEATFQPEKLRDFKVAFVPTIDPENTRVEFDEFDNVRIIRDGIEQKEYLANRRSMRSDDDVMREAERLTRQMPAGFYFIMTGENNMISNPIEFAPGQSEPLLSAVRWLTRSYPTEGDGRFSRIAQFFRGFRYIGRDSDSADEALAKIGEHREQQRQAKIAAAKQRKAKIRKTARKLSKSKRR